MIDRRESNLWNTLCPYCWENLDEIQHLELSMYSIREPVQWLRHWLYTCCCNILICWCFQTRIKYRGYYSGVTSRFYIDLRGQYQPKPLPWVDCTLSCSRRKKINKSKYHICNTHSSRNCDMGEPWAVGFQGMQHRKSNICPTLIFIHMPMSLESIPGLE